jgi:hypothetical protein
MTTFSLRKDKEAGLVTFLQKIQALQEAHQ